LYCTKDVITFIFKKIFAPILGLFTLADDSESSHETTESLEELDPLANHHVAMSQNFLINPNYRFNPNYQTEFSDPLANVPSMFPDTNI